MPLRGASSKKASSGESWKIIVDAAAVDDVDVVPLLLLLLLLLLLCPSSDAASAGDTAAAKWYVGKKFSDEGEVKVEDDEESRGQTMGGSAYISRERPRPSTIAVALEVAAALSRAP